ncbi:ATP-binding protein [Achromobacter mucicolens]|uniref:ATP-binding protein n=1 Tax=Achromobacter mucicolens TaxID=1389922 RepID=UPI00320A052A
MNTIPKETGSERLGVVLTDQNGVIRSWNGVMQALTGITARAAVGAPMEALRFVGDSTAEAPVEPKSHEAPRMRIADFEIPQNVGVTRCLVFAHCLDTGGARPFQHPTLRFQAEAVEKKGRPVIPAHSHIMQTEKLAAIGQLAAGVAHEINNPIGYVFSNLKTLGNYVRDLLKIVDAVEGVAHLDDLRHLKRNLEYDYIRNDLAALLSESADGIDRVKKIITALKDFSRPEEEGFRAFDLHHGIETTLKVVNNELKYKANIVCDFGVLPLVECNGSQINQVTLNLLINAVQAIETHGTITIRSGMNGAEVWFEVEDTGAGIEDDALHRIFEPFYTTKQLGKGTGLGLALSYGIVEQHRGRIEVVSKKGWGSRFRVWLPIHQKAAEE